MQAAQEKTDALSTESMHLKEYERTVEKLEPLLARMDTSVSAMEGKKIDCDNYVGLQEQLAGIEVRNLLVSIKYD